jgi:hypothetical protein
MTKLTMFLAAAVAAATVAIGALSAAPSASAQPNYQTLPKDLPCMLYTNLGSIRYPHGTDVTVIGSDHKYHHYLCNNGIWQEIKLLPSPVATFTGSFATVFTRG